MLFVKIVTFFAPKTGRPGVPTGTSYGLHVAQRVPLAYPVLDAVY